MGNLITNSHHSDCNNGYYGYGTLCGNGSGYGNASSDLKGHYGDGYGNGYLSGYGNGYYGHDILCGNGNGYGNAGGNFMGYYGNGSGSGYISGCGYSNGYSICTNIYNENNFFYQQ